MDPPRRTDTARRAPSAGLKWLAVLSVLASVCLYAAIAFSPMLDVRQSEGPVPVAVVPVPIAPGDPLCRGTVISIEINHSALRDKLRNHDSWWIVTVRADAGPSGSGAGGEMRFTMHSPSMSGFSRVGERVEVYNGATGLTAVPIPSAEP